MPIYKDDRNVITPLFDQIRRITETEDAMTFERATESLLNVTPGDELPSAEESAFGVENVSEEYGIVNFGTPKDETSSSGKRTPCNKYTANEAISIVGLRVYTVFYNNARTLHLYNANGELVRETGSITPTRNAWTTAYFDEPINIAKGESFVVSSSDVQYPSSSTASGVTINGKLTFEGSSSLGLQAEFLSYVVYGVDIIIGTIQAELPNDYQISRTTMDDIAEEVQRITGTESKMTTAQIVTALQGIATPTTE